MSARLYLVKAKQRVAADIYLVAPRPAWHLSPAPDRWRLCILVPTPAGVGTRRRLKPVWLPGAEARPRSTNRPDNAEGRQNKADCGGIARVDG